MHKDHISYKRIVLHRILFWVSVSDSIRFVRFIVVFFCLYRRAVASTRVMPGWPTRYARDIFIFMLIQSRSPPCTSLYSCDYYHHYYYHLLTRIPFSIVIYYYYLSLYKTLSLFCLKFCILSPTLSLRIPCLPCMMGSLLVMCDVWCVMCDVILIGNEWWVMCDEWCVMCDVWWVMCDLWCVMWSL